MNELSVSINLHHCGTYGTSPLGEALSAVAEAQQLRRACGQLVGPGTLPHYGAHSTSQPGQALSAAAEAQRLRGAIAFSNHGNDWYSQPGDEHAADPFFRLPYGCQ